MKDLGLLCRYWKLLRQEKPDLVITYTIKPNIYGGLVSRILRIPYAVNITGLGTAFQNPWSTAEFGDIPVQNCFRVPFASMVYVGDNAAKDFHAPRQLGMRWIFFRNNDGLYTKGAISEPVEVSSVEELKLVLCDMI